MICDNCRTRKNCNKIISERATYCSDRKLDFADATEAVKTLAKLLGSYGIYSSDMLENISAWREACFGSVSDLGNALEETRHDL